MRILFYDTKKYDRESFDKVLGGYPDIDMDYLEADLSPQTAKLAKGYDAICAFVNSDLSKSVLDGLHKNGISLLLMRCAGFNNIDLDVAKKYGMIILRVPGYSPEAVAEHAMCLAMSANRRIPKAYIRVRENNFSLVGLTGKNFYQKTAGIIGTGKIGAAMCRICHGMGMKVIAYDAYHNPDLDYVTYVDLNTLLKESDLISLHCPLTDDNYHLIQKSTIDQMKDGVVLVNTSRGALINTEDLIDGIKQKKFFGVGLDVYEEEGTNVYENREDDIVENCITSRLLSFPNVVVTSHQGFLTEEALEAISHTTLQNAKNYSEGKILAENLVTYDM